MLCPDLRTHSLTYQNSKGLSEELEFLEVADILGVEPTEILENPIICLSVENKCLKNQCYSGKWLFR